jgi:predicted small metal-binding protein
MPDDTIRRLRCACGWETTGTLDELVVAASEHGRRVHNMTPTRDEVEAMLLPLEPVATDHRAEPHDAGGRPA